MCLSALCVWSSVKNKALPMSDSAHAELPGAQSLSTEIRIHTYRWHPESGAPVQPRGVYLLHGMGEHAARYERLANRLAKHGWRVGAHDHPGHGRSGGQRGVADPPDQLVTEAQKQLEQFTRECGSAPILFAHSLGGIVATELVLARRVSVTGLMLSAPAIVPKISMMNRLKLRILSLVAPSFTVELPYDARLLTHDQDEISAAESDELIHGFKSAGLVRWLISSAQRALSSADQISMPTLLMIAGSDQLIDIAKTQAFAERVPSELLTKHVYEGCHHELLNETSDRRKQVLDDIMRWLESQQY